MDWHDCIISPSDIRATYKTAKKNKRFAGYFYRLFCDTSVRTYKNVADNMSSCNKWWELDYYRSVKVKDFLRTSLCKNKFCANCSRVRSGLLYHKWANIIKDFDSADLFHMVLTVPNVSGQELKVTVKRLLKKFTEFRRYLSGWRSSPVCLSLIGGVRSLEVTCSGDSFHPHLHCIVVVPGLRLVKNQIHPWFSYSRGELVRLFDSVELDIMKLWEVVFSPDKSISDFGSVDGFSCVLEPLGDQLHQITKYVFKPDDMDLTYEQFQNLYFALHNVRQIQGFGCFWGVQVEPDDEEYYQLVKTEIQEKLRAQEDPVTTVETLPRLYLGVRRQEYFVISRAKVHSLLKILDNLDKL